MNCKLCGTQVYESGIIKYLKLSKTKNIVYKKENDERIENECMGGGMYKQQILVCPSCQLIFSSVPDSSELEYLYNEGDDYTNYSSLDIEKPNYIERVNKAKALLNGLKLQFDSVLDIGASTGLFLNNFKDKKICGVETSYAGCKTAEERYSIGLYKGYFDKNYVDFINTEFDLICCMHILEHIENLHDFMKNIASVAKKYVYVEVPSLDCREKNEPFGFFAEEHLNYFSEFSLSYLFRLYGFKTVHISIDFMRGHKTANGFPMIRAVFEKSQDKIISSYPLFSSEDILKKYFSYSETKMNEINETISKIDSTKKIAIWGASFQTERLLAYTKILKKNLVCIFDNSPTKQKLVLKNDEITIPVLKPNKENLDKVDFIVISTWNNQEAIYNAMKELGCTEKALLLYENYEE